jgi:hypothetical protein
MTRSVVAVVLAVALAVITGTTVSRFYSNRLEDATRKVVAANAEATIALARAALADSARLLAEQEARAAAARAEAREAALRRQRARTDTLIAAAPDTCAPVIAALSADVDSALAVAADWREAHDSLASANRSLRASLDETSRALANLRNASETLVKRTRRPLLARLLPEAGFGATLGLSASTGRPDATIGITLTWRP